VARGLFLKPREAAGSRGWLLLSLLLGLGSVLAWWLPAAWLDWQPALAGSEPWRAWSAAWVHWSELHLLANLAGLAVVAALGWVAALPPPAAWAWAAAWPLTQAGLLWRAELAHYGGLSGVLHAAVAVAAVWLLLAPQNLLQNNKRRQRRIGAGIAAGLLLKILLERPWGSTLRQPADWDIAIAPLAHATGALAGVLCALLALLGLALRR
jgi:rhomboid family GlyGly-CTERM serine protease